jgi:hypothetical protein
MTLEEILAAQAESDAIDFKSDFDPGAQRDRVELLKDIVAIGNHGGGAILIGVQDDGSTTAASDAACQRLDPAELGDQIRRHTGRHEPRCIVHVLERDGRPVVLIQVFPTSTPIVFAMNGTYEQGGKQKNAFVEGKVYFRHNTKSEPGSTEDLERAIAREVARHREEWLGNIRRVVEAPLGARVSVIGPQETGADGNVMGVRLVNEPDAPEVPHWNPDETHPYRQKELVAEINRLLAEQGHVTSHDVLCVRRVHATDDNPNYSYKGKFGSRQYSPALVEWLTEEFRKDREFFSKTRSQYRAASERGQSTS